MGEERKLSCHRLVSVSCYRIILSEVLVSHRTIIFTDYFSDSSASKACFHTCFIWIQLRWGKKGNFLATSLYLYLVIESSCQKHWFLTRQSFLLIIFLILQHQRLLLLPWLLFHVLFQGHPHESHHRLPLHRGHEVPLLDHLRPRHACQDQEIAIL